MLSVILIVKGSQFSQLDCVIQLKNWIFTVFAKQKQAVFCCKNYTVNTVEFLQNKTTYNRIFIKFQKGFSGE